MSEERTERMPPSKGQALRRLFLTGFSGSGPAVPPAEEEDTTEV